MADQCIFCDFPADSTEHAWPDWLTKKVTGGRRGWQVEIVNLGSPLITVEQVNREIAVKVTCVCSRCNRGWMKRLEDRVSVFGKAMMDGRPSVLTLLQARLLARWGAKTAITLECAHGSGPYRTPRAIAEKVRQMATVPVGIDVLLGHYVGPRPLGQNRYVYRALDRDELYLCWSILLFGQVLMQVRINTRRVERPSLVGQPSRHFIPLTGVDPGQIQWPPEESVGEEFVAGFGAIMDDIVRRGGGYGD